MANGENRIQVGWAIGAIAGLAAFGMFVSDDFESGVGCCCWSILFLLVADSGHKAKKRWNQQKIIYVQQAAPQPVIVHHTYQQPQPAAQRPAPAAPAAPAAPGKTAVQWALEAANLEKARDWEGAAQAYQKAGLFDEAGRVRETHLEKDDSTVVNIERVGDTVLHDSVMMGETEKKDPRDEF